MAPTRRYNVRVPRQLGGYSGTPLIFSFPKIKNSLFLFASPSAVFDVLNIGGGRQAVPMVLCFGKRYI